MLFFRIDYRASATMEQVEHYVVVLPIPPETTVRPAGEKATACKQPPSAN
jgi:hypothetical protein